MSQDYYSRRLGSLNKERPFDNLPGIKSAATLPFRYIADAFKSTDDIFRGLGRAAGAVLSDVIAEPVRGIAPGGKPGWWRDPETGQRGSSVYKDVLTPVGHSFKETGKLGLDLSPLAGAYRATVGDENIEDQLSRVTSRVKEFDENPFIFTLEHLGNVAIAGAAASIPLRGGIGAARGAITPAQAVKGSTRPFAGAEARRLAWDATRAGAAEGSLPAQLTLATSEVIAHPYRSAWRKARTSNTLNLIKDPAFKVDSITGTGQRVNNRGDILDSPPPDASMRLDDISPEMKSAKESAANEVRAEQSTTKILESAVETRPLTNSESMGRAIGEKLEDMRMSEGYQRYFGSDASQSRKIVEDLRKGISTGLGNIAESLRNKFGDIETPWGNMALRRSFDPSRNERVFVRNIRNMHKRKDSETLGSLIDDVSLEGINIGNRVQRGLNVASGKRVVGETLDASGLYNRVLRVIDEGKTRAEATGQPLPDILRDLMPDMDPQSLYLLGLQAAEKVTNLPEGSLTSALSDYVTMDKFGDLNRKAQQVMKDSGVDVPQGIGSRYRLPDEHLGVDINALPAETQRLFYDTAANYREYLANVREPRLIGEGVIPEAGARVGRQADEPTRFPLELEDLPLTKAWREKLEKAGTNVDAQRAVIDELRETMDKLNEDLLTTKPTQGGSKPATDAGNLPGASQLQADLFDALAKEQRGIPEQAMLDAQKVLGGGELSYLLEHVGDLTHRMSKKWGPGDYGHMDIVPKLQRALDILDNPNLPGFIQQSLRSQYRHVSEHGLGGQPFTGSFDDFVNVVNESLSAYAQAHKSLTTHNPTQKLAKDAAVAIGEQDFAKARANIEKLAGRAETPVSWRKAAGHHSLPAREGIPTTRVRDPRYDVTTTVPTTKAAQRVANKIVNEQIKLAQMVTKYGELENIARLDPNNMPASARDLANYAQTVAPEQARVLRELADELGGSQDHIRHLADELDAIPKSLADLNSAEVYLAYLRDIKDAAPSGHYGPGTFAPTAGRGVRTSPPGGARRRGTSLDIEFNRDFRARAYWQEAEFQSWFMQRQADNFVRQAGIAESGRQRLNKAGLTDDVLNEMTPGQVQQQLERLGLRTYEPDKFFTSARKPLSDNPLDAQWITPYAERYLSKALAEPNNFVKYLMEGVYDPLVNAWKVSALPLRPAWQVNNYLGNATLSMLVGRISPFDYPSLLRASYHAVKQWNAGLTDTVRIPLNHRYRQELIQKLNNTTDAAQKANIQNMLDNNAIILDNRVLNEIASNGLTKGDFAFLNNSQFMRDTSGSRNILRQFDIDVGKAAQGPGWDRARNLKQTGREIVDFSYHVNSTVDTMHRAMVYVDNIGKGATHQQALAAIDYALSNYSKLSAFEMGVFKRIYPFYPWMKHMLDVVVRSTDPVNIQRSVIFLNLTNILGQPNEWEAMLPEWAGGHIYMGMTDDNTPTFLSTRGLNPFLDVFDPLQQPGGRGLLRPITPPVQYAAEKMFGTSILTGRPFSSPDRPFGSMDTRTPPTSEYVFRNIPQLGVARNIYRDIMGQPLSRYGTGEPMFGSPSERHRSSLQNVMQYGGANIKPLDVRRMHERELVNAFREETLRRRQEDKERTQGGTRLRDIVNPFSDR